jgi:hypothetical protein
MDFVHRSVLATMEQMFFDCLLTKHGLNPPDFYTLEKTTLPRAALQGRAALTDSASW